MRLISIFIMEFHSQFQFELNLSLFPNQKLLEECSNLEAVSIKGGLGAKQEGDS